MHKMRMAPEELSVRLQLPRLLPVAVREVSREEANLTVVHLVEADLAIRVVAAELAAVFTSTLAEQVRTRFLITLMVRLTQGML